MSDLDLSALVPECAAFNTELERLLATVPRTETVPPEVTRRNRVEGKGIFPAPEKVAEARDRTIDGRAGPIRLRTFVPPTVRGVYLHIHGGGWVLGAADQQDVLLWTLAQRAEVAVVSVDYRLAPEHPFPAGPDDCEDAARWLLDGGGAELGADRFAIGGESAGAHLVALTLLRLRDAGMGGGFRGANLIYGVFDLTGTPSQRLWGDRNLVLSWPLMEWFYDCFLPGMAAEDRRSPGVSPLYADLGALPPARFVVGTQDPLLDDTLFMEARWRMAGNGTELEIYPEAAHGFPSFPIGMARAHMDAQVGWLARMLE